MAGSPPAAAVDAAPEPAGSGLPADRSPARDRDRLDARIARFSKAVILAMVGAFCIAVWSGAGLSDEPPPSGDARLGGDYPAFHGAGSIVVDGDLESLYDPLRQQEAQAGLGVDGYLAFAYPPHVAAAYAPLAALGFRVGYAVHTVLMAGALGAALWLVAGPVPGLRRWLWPATAAALGFYPLFKAVGGGQNTAMTVLLLAVVWRALHDDREIVAGVAAGLLLFRPQYAIPLIGLLALARHHRAVLSAFAVGVVTWAATAAFFGVSWLSVWFEQVRPFVERDADVNAGNSISFLGFLQATLGEGTGVVALGVVGAGAVSAMLAWLWAHPNRYGLADRMAVAAAGILLLSPHTMFYDAGLLVIVGAGALARSSATVPPVNVVGVLAIVWLGGFSHLLAPTIGATPLALVVMAAFAAVLVTMIGSRPTERYT